MDRKQLFWLTNIFSAATAITGIALEMNLIDQDLSIKTIALIQALSSLFAYWKQKQISPSMPTD